MRPRLHAFLIVCALASLAAQRADPVTADRVRALARAAAAEARGDKTEVVLGLDQRFRARWGDFESFPVTIVRREDLSVVLSSPFMTFRRALAEYLRMNDPISRIPWVAAAVITVGPLQLSAPDITRVVVARNGTPVASEQNTLKPMTFTNGSGESAVIHAGDVRFSMAAFAPGATVTVSAVPRTGDPFSVTLEDSQLRTLK